ncbi:MAG: Spy/CpxP family protein refolding chaperone [Candidatus Thiodiazotropha sp.]
MKPMNKRLAVLGLTTLLISGAGTALAFGGHKDHHGCDHDGRQTPMAALSRLDGLTDEQKTQLRQIRQEARDTFRELRDQMRDNRSDLRDAMMDKSDLETIRTLAKKQGDQVARMIVLRAEIRDKVNGVLTEEQRQQLADMRGKGWSDDIPREKMRY